MMARPGGLGGGGELTAAAPKEATSGGDVVGRTTGEGVGRKYASGLGKAERPKKESGFGLVFPKRERNPDLNQKLPNFLKNPKIWVISIIRPEIYKNTLCSHKREISQCS